MTNILIYVLIFWVSFIIGFASNALFTAKFKTQHGTIVVDVDKETERTVYSLILDDFPEKLESKKEVVFKIDSSALSSADRM